MKKYLPTDGGGLLPDAQTAIEHFLRSSKQFNYNRKELAKYTVAKIDSSKPLGRQLKRTILFLKKKMSTK